jgi:hypothetical protein
MIMNPPITRIPTMRFPFLALFLSWLTILGAPAQTVNDLIANYTGTAVWNAGSSTMTFVTSGEIAFLSGFGRTTNNASRWDVPAGVHRITIAANVTVTGQFKYNSSGNYVVAGQHRYTSRLYGTPEQRFTQNRGLSAVDFSTILTANNTVTVSNLTSFDPKGYHIRGGSGGPVHVSNCDFLDTRGGRQNNSDGYVGGGGSVVRDCFFETGDDIFKVYWGTTAYTDNIVRMVPNTVPIQFGWGDYGSGAVGNFTNLIVLGTEGRGTDRRIIDANTGSYTKTLNLTGCDIQNPNSTLIRLGDSGQTANVTINNAYIQVKQHSTVNTGSTLNANICGGAPPAASYDCRAVIPAVPAAPDSFTAVGTGAAIQLNWTDMSSNESMFRIERATSGSGPWTERGFLIHNKTTWTDTFVTVGTPYYYRMRAYNTAGYSAYTPVRSATSAPPIEPPAAPFDLLAIVLAANQVQLNWTDGSSNEAGFEIQRATHSGGPWGFLGHTASNVTTYLDSTVLANTTYFYQVRATNSGSASAWAGPAQAITPPAGGGGGYTNLDVAMSAAHWQPATNPAPPHLDAAINFSSATNLNWTWDDSTGSNAALVVTINRADPSGPGGLDVYFFGNASFSGTATQLRLVMDVAKATPNIGTLHFALRQGTNLFHTSSGLNNVPGTTGPVVTYELEGVTTLSLKTNGVAALTGLAWVPRYAGTALDFGGGPPLEFGFRISAALGAGATTTQRGPVLDNFLVEVAGVLAQPPPPELWLEAAGGGQWQLRWESPEFVLQTATNVAGPWTEVIPPAQSPHLIAPTNPAAFYQLKWTAP